MPKTVHFTKMHNIICTCIHTHEDIHEHVSVYLGTPIYICIAYPPWKTTHDPYSRINIKAET